MLGKYKLDDVYNVDSYLEIKSIPSKSVDCIYIDIPYLYTTSVGKVGVSDDAFTERVNKKTAELKKLNIDAGIDYDIFDEMRRVMKKVNLFVWCSKLQV